MPSSKHLYVFTSSLLSHYAHLTNDGLLSYAIFEISERDKTQQRCKCDDNDSSHDYVMEIVIVMKAAFLPHPQTESSKLKTVIGSRYGTTDMLEHKSVR